MKTIVGVQIQISTAVPQVPSPNYGIPPPSSSYGTPPLSAIYGAPPSSGKIT